MLIWKGFGFAVPLIYLFTAVVVEKYTEDYFVDPQFYQTRPWGPLLTGAISFVLITVVAVVSSRRQGRAVIDKETGEEFDLKPKDSFFFIPMIAWGFIAFLVSAYVAIRTVW